MLANNILDKNFIDLLKPLDNYQAAPVLFLWVVKLSSLLTGTSELALRTFSFLCFAFAGIFFLLYLKKHTQNIIVLVFALGLFVFNAFLIRYSSELKQYITDLFFSTLFLFLTQHYTLNKSNRTLLMLTIAGVLGVFFSHIVVILISTIIILFILNSIENKQVNKSVGWPVIAGLAAGGAGLYYGAGAAAGGAAGAAGTGGLSAGAVPSLAGGLALGGETAAVGSGLGAGGFGIAAPAAGSTFGALSAGAAPVAGQALTASAAAAVPGSAEAIYAAQTASNAAGAGNPFSINAAQAMAANKMMGGFGQQQQQGGQSSSVGIRQGQPVNTADPIAALLAPKKKKKERISLL
jgi:hypothetical protein